MTTCKYIRVIFQKRGNIIKHALRIIDINQKEMRPGVLRLVNQSALQGYTFIIPWICYERSFSEFYLSIWNQLVFNKRFQLFVQSLQPYLLIFASKTICVFPIYWSKNKLISEFRRTNPQELKCWSTCCVNYFLRYYLMIQHQPIVKRVNGTHEWAHRPYQFLSAPYHCCLYKCRLKIKCSHSRAADRCLFVRAQ